MWPSLKTFWGWSTMTQIGTHLPLSCTHQHPECLCVCRMGWRYLHQGVCVCVCVCVGGGVHVYLCICLCGVGGGYVCLMVCRSLMWFVMYTRVMAHLETPSPPPSRHWYVLFKHIHYLLFRCIHDQCYLRHMCYKNDGVPGLCLKTLA